MATKNIQQAGLTVLTAVVIVAGLIVAYVVFSSPANAGNRVSSSSSSLESYELSEKDLIIQKKYIEKSIEFLETIGIDAWMDDNGNMQYSDPQAVVDFLKSKGIESGFEDGHMYVYDPAASYYLLGFESNKDMVDWFESWYESLED